MSIRLKILLGCLSLALLTICVGVTNRESERKLGKVALQIYDQAFMAMSYLRSSQNGLAVLQSKLKDEIAREPGETVSLRSQLDDDTMSALAGVREDVGIAEERAMSAEGAAAAHAIAEKLAAMQDNGDLTTSETLARFNALQHEYDTAVEIFAGDGYRYRRRVGQIVEDTLATTVAAIGGSGVIALFITFMLSRSIVPPMRQAVALAQAISNGKLDNDIKHNADGEAGQLLASLEIMQSSISENLARINGLMALEREMHYGEMGLQTERFEAAVNNMPHGLCMFDADGVALVCNRAFIAMFGSTEGALASQLIAHADLTISGLKLVNMDDGRNIAVSIEPMSAGGCVAIFEDVSERRRIEEKLAFMARHDSLTGLPNRVMLREYLENASSDASGQKRLSVFCLDLDGFKNVNDTLGHPVGDELLTAVADRLSTAAPTLDMVVRLGGDEFALVTSEPLSPEKAAAVANAAIAAIADPFNIKGHQISISTSIGVAIASASTKDAEELLKNADLALYRAKAEGRNTYRFFEAGMDAKLRERRSLERDLRVALPRGEFELFYQPLVDTGTGLVSGFEALLRWRHPERGLVSPMLFIPVAEEIGLIEDIGAWALKTACVEAMTWADDIKVAVNLSPLQFRNRALASLVAKCLAHAGLPPRRLELEITESVLLHDSDQVLSILNEIKQLGVSISMDDFGTGYSSLSYLRKFPFDKIKIDQCFVRSLFQNDGLAIVRAVIGLGRSLNMAVIAEGVETLEELDALRSEGCLQAQGYFFSRPCPASEANSLISFDLNAGAVEPEKAA